jgi:hypothetical protein
MCNLDQSPRAHRRALARPCQDSRCLPTTAPVELVVYAGRPASCATSTMSYLRTQFHKTELMQPAAGALKVRAHDALGRGTIASDFLKDQYR